jgi:hypothetical protein
VGCSETSDLNNWETFYTTLGGESSEGNGIQYSFTSDSSWTEHMCVMGFVEWHQRTACCKYLVLSDATLYIVTQIYFIIGSSSTYAINTEPLLT